jgi:hypothetical protein
MLLEWNGYNAARVKKLKVCIFLNSLRKFTLSNTTVAYKTVV